MTLYLACEDLEAGRAQWDGMVTISGQVMSGAGSPGQQPWIGSAARSSRRAR